MHNVKKTAATEAYRAGDERKRATRISAYLDSRDRIFAKRDAGELDEEILELTGEVLQKNPDVYTYWSIRREAISELAKEIGAGVERDERLAKLFTAELVLTKSALMANPKSYSAWHHRFWAFNHHPAGNIKRELGMCEEALAYDCRNFHCWDHRRSVAQMANLSKQEELDFSDRLIALNPSNYSAWHYRATLLPTVRPGTDGMAISEECLEEELKKITDVCCVNSQDQTAWTYCRWLMDIAATPAAAGRERVRSALKNFVDMCQELLKEEDDNPSIYLALTRGEAMLSDRSREKDGVAAVLRDRFETIKRLDPQRRCMYDDILRGYLSHLAASGRC